MRGKETEAGSRNNETGFYNNRWSTSYECIQGRLPTERTVIFHLFELPLRYIPVSAKWKRHLI